MGSLGDALRKAGFITPQQEAGGSGRRDRRNRKDGRRGGEERSRDATRGQPSRRVAAVDLLALRANAAGDEGARDRAIELLRAHGTRKGLNGRRFWHYLAEDGSLPPVGVDGAVAGQLERGEAALASDGESVFVVDQKTAELLLDQDPRTVVFFNR